MTLFLLFVTAAIITAVGLIVIPLFYRRAVRDSGHEDLSVLADSLAELDADLGRGQMTQDEYQVARAELLQSALEVGSKRNQAAPPRTQRPGWIAAVLVGAIIPAAAIGIYAFNGYPSAVPTNHSGVDDANAPILATIKRLEARLASNDSDAQGWLLLARSHYAAGQAAEGLRAYTHAVAIMPDDPDLLIEYANALARQNNRDLRGKPTELIQKALGIDPDNYNALVLAGAAAMQTGNTDMAVKQWSHLEALIPEDSPDRTRVSALIAQAQGRPAPAAAQKAVQAAATTAPSTVSGTIVVADSVADKVSPSDTLFVFARVPDGPPMPIAAVRKPAAGWPVSFTLDDSTAMIEGMMLSSFDSLDIVARVSRAGNATPQAGDVQGSARGVRLGSQDVTVVLDELVF